MSYLVWHRGEFEYATWGAPRRVMGWTSGVWGINEWRKRHYSVTNLTTGHSCNPRHRGGVYQQLSFAEAKRWAQALEDAGLAAIKSEEHAKKFRAMFNTLVERRAWQETPLT